MMYVLKSLSALTLKSALLCLKIPPVQQFFHSSHLLSALQPFPIVPLQQKAEKCKAPLQMSSSATSLNWGNSIVCSVLSHLGLTEAGGDKAKEAHTGLSHYRLLISALLRQYQQLLSADGSEGLHSPQHCLD